MILDATPVRAPPHMTPQPAGPSLHPPSRTRIRKDRIPSPPRGRSFEHKQSQARDSSSPAGRPQPVQNCPVRIVRLFGRRAVEASYPFYPLRHPLRPDRVLLWEHALQRPACARVPRSRAILTLSSNSDFACLYVIDPMGDQRALVGGGGGGKGRTARHGGFFLLGDCAAERWLGRRARAAIISKGRLAKTTHVWGAAGKGCGYFSASGRQDGVRSSCHSTRGIFVGWRNSSSIFSPGKRCCGNMRYALCATMVLRRHENKRGLSFARSNNAKGVRTTREGFLSHLCIQKRVGKEG